MHRFASRPTLEIALYFSAIAGLTPAFACETLCAHTGGARIESTARGVHPFTVIDPDHDDAYLYRLPYGDAQSHPVLQGYSDALSHRGAEEFTVDFGMPEGTPVHAAREGTVVRVEDGHTRACWAAGCGEFANFVTVLHADGTLGEYYHLAPGSAVVEVGDEVARGQVLARSGNTGYSTAAHLHFGVYRAARSGATQSIPVRFLTRNGVALEPRTGARYSNPAGGR